MIRKMTRKKKQQRYDANAAAVLPIYLRVTQGGSAGWLSHCKPEVRLCDCQ
jgi:hypothetical protein